MSILSHRGYSIPLKGLDPKLLLKYKQDLTITPYIEKPEYGTNVEPIKIYTQTDQRFYGPRQWGMKTFGKPDQNKLEEYEATKINIKFNGDLRPHQQSVVTIMEQGFQSHGGGILALHTGWGKTAFGIYMACKMGLKTLVVSHTTSLMQQWVERIQQFAPTAKIGIIQQSKVDVENKDIVIASLKTLALKDFQKGVFESFGLVLWDEVHLMATNLFSQAFPKCASKYAIGLSATPFRKDKCDIIFQYFIGPIVFIAKRGKDEAIVAQCMTMMIPESELDIRYNVRGEIIYTPSVINIVNNKKRTKCIVDMIVKHAKKGRKILILSEYISHLKDMMALLAREEEKEYDSWLKKYIKDTSTLLLNNKMCNNAVDIIMDEVEKKMCNKSLFTYGLYIGEMKNNDRKVSEEKDVILGTYKLASVGMDIPKLNTLIMASPRKDIEQSVGRILRKDTKGGAINPLIIDIIDNHGIFMAQSRVRKDFYKQYGYTIENIKIDPNTNEILHKRVLQNKKDDHKKIVTLDLNTISKRINHISPDKKSNTNINTTPATASTSKSQPVLTQSVKESKDKEELTTFAFDDSE